MSPALLTTTQRKRRLEIAQPEMTKRFLLLHRLNIHIAVSNKLGLGAWLNGIWNSMARNTGVEPPRPDGQNRGMQKQGRWLQSILGLPIHRFF